MKTNLAAALVLSAFATDAALAQQRVPTACS
jgi:hypothetical protein